MNNHCAHVRVYYLHRNGIDDSDVNFEGYYRYLKAGLDSRTLTMPLQSL